MTHASAGWLADESRALGQLLSAPPMPTTLFAAHPPTALARWRRGDRRRRRAGPGPLTFLVWRLALCVRALTPRTTFYPCRFGRHPILCSLCGEPGRVVAW